MMPHQPFSPYLVCATPRSGSTLLCETLRATGVAGNPLEHFEVLRHSARVRQPREYFGAGFDAIKALDRLPPLEVGDADPEPSSAWWLRIAETGTTANGTWGGKLMWNHTENLVERARELPEVPAGGDLGEVLDALFGPNLRLVFVTRPDKVDQGVSLWRAVQTQTWRAEVGKPQRTPEYEFAGIDHLVRQLRDHDESWRAWFAAGDRPFFEVTYDELAADPQRAVGSVLRYLGLPDDDVPPAATRRQGDDLSSRWAQRYRDEASTQ